MMRNKIEIQIDGESYPCTPSLGAMLRFKQETGKEANQLDSNSITEMATFLWSCVIAGCAREKVKFSMTLMDFADCLSVDELTKWNEAVQALLSEHIKEIPEEQKKTR